MTMAARFEFDFRVCAAGIRARQTAFAQGRRIKLARVKLTTGNAARFDPSGAETDVPGVQVAEYPIAGGDSIDEFVTLGFYVPSADLPQAAYAVGAFLDDGSLAFIASNGAAGPHVIDATAEQADLNGDVPVMIRIVHSERDPANLEPISFDTPINVMMAMSRRRWGMGRLVTPDELAASPPPDDLLVSARQMVEFTDELVRQRFVARFAWDDGIRLPAGVASPSGIAGNAFGDLYALDEGSKAYYRHDGASWDAPIALPTAVTSPGGLAVNPDGNVVVLDRGTLRYYTRSGGVWDTGGIALPASVLPGGVAVDGEGNLYIAQATIGATGFYRRDAATGAWGAVVRYPTSQFGGAGIAITPDGGVAVARADSNTDDIYVYSGGAWGAAITGPTSSAAMGMAVDAEGNFLIVAGSRYYTRRGGVWDAGGALPPGRSRFVDGIAVTPSGDIVVIDRQTDRLYTRSGGAWDAGVALPSVAGDAKGIAYGADGTIYVVDSTDRRIYLRRPTWDAGVALPAAASNPTGIAIDGAGSVYVVDATARRFYTRSGGGWNAGVALPAALSDPAGIAVASNGAVLALDASTGRYYTYSGGAWDGGFAIPPEATRASGLTIDDEGKAVVIDAATLKFYTVR